MDILDLIKSQLFSEDTLNNLAQEANAKPEQVEQLTNLAIPEILKKLQQNASTQEGAESLSKAVDQHETDLDDLMGFFNKTDQQDGDKILGHIFGAQKPEVEANLASSTGLDMGTVISLLTKFAPMILSMLALKKKFMPQHETQKAPTQAPGGLDLGGILGDLMGGFTGQTQSKKQQEPSVLDGLKDIMGGFFK